MGQEHPAVSLNAADALWSINERLGFLCWFFARLASAKLLAKLFGPVPEIPGMNTPRLGNRFMADIVRIARKDEEAQEEMFTAQDDEDEEPRMIGGYG